MKRLTLCLLCICAVYLPVSAHVLDQYLQVTQLALAPSGVTVELRLIPGAQVAERIFALLDADRDGQLSAAEEQAYAERVRQDLTLEINGQRLPLQLVSQQFAARRALNEGTGALRLTLTAKANLGESGARQLFFQNHHLPELSSYLVNALVPAAREIAITGQQRDALQHGLRLDYRVMPAASSLAMRWLMLCAVALCLIALLSHRKIYKLLRRNGLTSAFVAGSNEVHHAKN